MRTYLLSVILLAATACGTVDHTDTAQNPVPLGSPDMNLGAFSVSLTVKDLATSRAFYEKLGFEMKGGVPEQNWIILRNGHATIGLFQGMFERNILTFNPGWTRDAEALDEFTDVRELQRRLRAKGIEFEMQADESTTGPASLVVVDPDGNMILLDQHVK